METPAKFLHIRGMPKILPFELFSDGLNQVLTAKNEMELMAAGMFLTCSSVDDGTARDLRGILMEAHFDNDYSNGKTGSQRQREKYVDMVHLIIVSHLESEIELLKTYGQWPPVTEEFVQQWTDKAFKVDSDSELQWFQMKDCIQQIADEDVPDSMLTACGVHKKKLNDITYVVNEAGQRLNWS